jgi:hypothetical protein
LQFGQHAVHGSELVGVCMKEGIKPLHQGGASKVAMDTPAPTAAAESM